MDIVLKPIGLVHTQATDDEVRRGKGLEAELEIYEQFEPALDGIDGFSHLFVIGFFHKLRPEQIGPLRVRPKGLMRRGLKLEDLPVLGVFALDSPTRPNPIGLTLVRVLKREGRRLTVEGLDYFEGTPILDIKAYRPQYGTDECFLPEWYRDIIKKGELAAIENRGKL